MAPVMLPRASVSLPLRIQITELNFSGSSVATGVMSSETISGLAPRRSLDVAHRLHEELGAER